MSSSPAAARGSAKMRCSSRFICSANGARRRPIGRSQACCGCPGDMVDSVLGDATTLTAHRVMAAVFDGDPQPLYDVILNEHAEEFVRSRMLETVAMVTLRALRLNSRLLPELNRAKPTYSCRVRSSGVRSFGARLR